MPRKPSKVPMKRLHTFLTEEQFNELSRISEATGKTTAEVYRQALDWYLGATSFTRETMDMLEKVHPDIPRMQFPAWLAFQWRLDHEGRRNDKENGSKEVKLLLARLVENTAPIGEVIEALMAKGMSPVDIANQFYCVAEQVAELYEAHTPGK